MHIDALSIGRDFVGVWQDVESRVALGHFARSRAARGVFGGLYPATQLAILPGFFLFFCLFLSPPLGEFPAPLGGGLLF